MATSDAASAVIGLPEGSPGSGLYGLNVWATIVFSVAAVLAVLVPSLLRIPFAVLSCVLFAAGIVAFLAAYAQALRRSRTDQISLPGIFGLSGSCPRAVQWRFHALTTVQVVVAVVTAAIQPFTAQAFGILVPMLGLGLGGLWASRHGEFSERVDRRRKAFPSAPDQQTQRGEQ